MKSKVNDDRVLFSEIRHSLNKETQLLDTATRSKLTQVRFNVIDHALPAQPRIFNVHRNNFPWGMTAALTVMFAVLVVQITPFNFDDSIAVGDNSSAISEEFIEEDSEDALRMYEWLYKNYG